MDNRKITIPIVIVLVLAVISLGVAFATFATTLNIGGIAEVQVSNWDIYFTTTASGGSRPQSSTPMPSNTIATTGTVSDTTASIIATTFTWSANFKSPGDKVVYTIYVKNGGSYNAKVTNINMPAIQCTTDPKNVCSKLSYGLYTDSTGTTPLTTSFTVGSGDTETFYLIAKLADDYGGTSGENLTGSDLTTSQISATVTFGQDGSSSNGETSGGGNSGGGNSGGNSGGGNSSTSEQTKYYSATSYNPTTSVNEEIWVDSIAELSRVHNDVYVKKVGEDYSVCFIINSAEHCFDENTTRASFTQTCNAIGGYIIDGLGSGLGPDYSGIGISCMAVEFKQNEYSGDWYPDDADLPYYTYNLHYKDNELPILEIGADMHYDMDEYGYQSYTSCDITYPNNIPHCEEYIYEED